MKQQMITAHENAMQENSSWINQIYGSYFYGEDRNYWMTDYENLVNSITVKDIKAAAKKYFNTDSYCVGFMLPEVSEETK